MSISFENGRQIKSAKLLYDVLKLDLLKWPDKFKENIFMRDSGKI